MRGPRATEGAAMILVVLFTLLLLAGILAATLRLGLGSRQNTADQAATLRAQYAAESGVSLARSRLRDVQVILSPSREGASGKIDHIVVPYTTDKEILRAQAQAFCNKVGLSSAWQDTSEFVTADDQSYPGAKECLVASGTNPLQFDVLAQYVQPAAFAVLPEAERPSNINDYASRLTWWNALLSQEQTLGETKSLLRPLRTVQLTPVKYRFYIQLESMRVRGQQDQATRVLAASRTAESQWWFEIELPSLLDDVLMTNHHRARPSDPDDYRADGAPGVNFDDQIFDGSVHTNEKFLFTNDSGAQFRGKVSSVGCVDLPENGLASGGNCTSVPGVHLANTTPTSPPATENTPEKKDKWIADEIAKLPRTVQFVKQENDPSKIDYKKTDFTAEYKPLPTNENDQRAAAQSGGLILGSLRGVELAAGDGSGNPLSEYQAATPRADEGKWKEPSPTYQYIRLRETREECVWEQPWIVSDYRSGNRYYSNTAWNSTPSEHRTTYDGRYYRKTRDCDVTTGDIKEEYRYGSDKKLYKKTSGGWSFVKNDFNGVIYGENMVLRGPERRSSNKEDGSLGNVPPAVASFAGVTLASTGDVYIESDLTVSDTPCAFAALKANPPCTKRPTNILGVYSQSGDITLSEKTRRNLNLHAAIIASTGQVTADDYNLRPDQGEVHLIGSLIENWYGAFGLVGNPGKGYGRDFTYDQRLREGVTPPLLPGVAPLDHQGGC